MQYCSAETMTGQQNIVPLQIGVRELPHDDNQHKTKNDGNSLRMVPISCVTRLKMQRSSK